MQQLAAEDMGSLSGNVLGVLYVEVVESRSLAAKDYNGLSDPYAIVKYETQEQKTGVVTGSLFPKWRTKFLFQVTDPNSQLIIDVMDFDEFSAHDFMGRVMLSLSEMSSEEGFDGWIPLEIRKSSDVVSGDLHVRARYQPKSGLSDARREHLVEMLALLANQEDFVHLALPLTPFLVRILLRADMSAKKPAAKSGASS